MICHCSTSCLSTIAKMICNIQQSPNRRTFGNLEIPGERLLFHILFDFRLLSRFFWVSIKTLMQLSLLQGSAPWLPLEEKALHTSKFLPFYLCPIHVARSSNWTCHFWARWELMFLCSYHHFPHHHRLFPDFIWVWLGLSETGAPQIQMDYHNFHYLNDNFPIVIMDSGLSSVPWFGKERQLTTQFVAHNGGQGPRTSGTEVGLENCQTSAKLVIQLVVDGVYNKPTCTWGAQPFFVQLG